MRAAPWKSGASAPRKAIKSEWASAPVVALCVRNELCRNRFHSCRKPVPPTLSHSEVIPRSEALLSAEKQISIVIPRSAATRNLLSPAQPPSPPGAQTGKARLSASAATPATYPAAFINSLNLSKSCAAASPMTKYQSPLWLQLRTLNESALCAASRKPSLPTACSWKMKTEI
jgi:hypothetical protein